MLRSTDQGAEFFFKVIFYGLDRQSLRRLGIPSFLSRKNIAPVAATSKLLVNCDHFFKNLTQRSKVSPSSPSKPKIINISGQFSCSSSTSIAGFN